MVDELMMVETQLDKALFIGTDTFSVLLCIDISVTLDLVPHKQFRGQSLLDKWNLIPEGIDILMTHGPPLGFRDWVPKELQRVGCVELLNTVQRRVRPKLHVFGGIHEGYGIMTDGYTTYINASTCTVSFQPTNPPIIFDLPNPQGS
ncbi:hypothetical protein H8959_002363 [Pygathrix nigripes]